MSVSGLLKNDALAFDKINPTAFFETLNAARKSGKSLRTLRLALTEMEQATVSKKTLRLLASNDELQRKFTAIAENKDPSAKTSVYEQTNKLVLSLVAKGQAIIVEYNKNKTVTAKMTKAAHALYKQKQQKAQTDTNNSTEPKKKIAKYDKVQEVETEDFKKLAEVASQHFHVELEPVLEKADASHDHKDHPKHTQGPEKEMPETKKEAHPPEMAPPKTETPKAATQEAPLEETQSQKNLELQKEHALEDMAKEEEEKAREKADAVLRKEEKKEEQHQELLHKEIVSDERVKGLEKDAIKLQQQVPHTMPPPTPAPTPAPTPSASPIPHPEGEASSKDGESAVKDLPPKEGP